MIIKLVVDGMKVAEGAEISESELTLDCACTTIRLDWLGLNVLDAQRFAQTKHKAVLLLERPGAPA